VSSDGDLARAAAAGQTQACEQLVRRWSARVLAVCRARVRSDAAEDLAQETLLRAVRGIRTLGDPEKFGPWICGIAHRTCLDWLKCAQRSEVSYDALPESSEPAESEHDDSDVQELMSEVARLPEPFRETLMLYYAENCTYDELAKLLGVSAATVNARLTKARAILRGKLCPRGQKP
jgi:RNA polymerase sigma-70 factor (ECF subfamily)